MKEKLLSLNTLRRYKEKRDEEIDAKGYVTNSVENLANYYLKSQTYSKTEIGALIAAIKQFKYQSVTAAEFEELTATEDTMNIIWLVPARGENVTQNAKAEYITIISGGSGTELDPYTYAWEKIGDTDIDLSGYATTVSLNMALQDYVSSTALATTLAGYQTKIDSDHKLSADLVANGDTNKVYTATEKNKLYGIEAGAQVNIIESVEVKPGVVNGSKLVEIDDTKAKLIVAENTEIQELFSAERVLLYESELSEFQVAFIYKDNLSGMLKYLPVENIAERQGIDAVRYFEKPYMRFHRGKNGRAVAMHKSVVAAKPWATQNRYKLEIDTTTGGSLNFAITINGSAKSGTVTWNASDTLSDIAGRFTGTGDYFSVTKKNGEDFIRIVTAGYSNSIFTLSNVTGEVTLTDLSFYCRVNGIQQAETHRTWQVQDVNTMFPGLGFLPANTRQYANNGMNLSYRCIANISRAKTYYGTSGSGHGGVDTYLEESAVSARMSQIGFESCNNSGNTAAQALYDKYNGDYDAYLEASRVKINDTNSNGIESQSYDNGDTQTSILVSITTMDFDGTYIAAFPAAYEARSITDADLGGGNMPTNHEISVFMDDDMLYNINLGIYALGGGTALSITAYYWSVAQYIGNLSWFYYGNDGCLSTDGKYYSFQGRSLVYCN
jgi:hypothetical protein